MDALDFFLIRHRELSRAIPDDVTRGLTDAQLRGRPHPGVNPIVWTLWHTARVADVGVNRFVGDRAQVLDTGGWLPRLMIDRRDVGTGMRDAEVDDLAARIDLAALRGYWDAVGLATTEVVERLRGQNIEDVVPVERVKAAAIAERAVADEAAWLTEFWAKGRTRAWMLAQTGLLHVGGHFYEARVAKGLWGHPSP
ncbi:MAG: DinB family protein [Candidatus Rokubacteria bacterium]|nr:DinB family protein [Candidatus Rokubacteria bacterium]